MFNPSNTDIVFSLPQSPSGRRWKLSINTAAQRGMDIYLKDEPIIEREKITVEAHSMIILTA